MSEKKVRGTASKGLKHAENGYCDDCPHAPKPDDGELLFHLQIDAESIRGLTGREYELLISFIEQRVTHAELMHLSFAIGRSLRRADRPDGYREELKARQAVYGMAFRLGAAAGENEGAVEREIVGLMQAHRAAVLAGAGIIVPDEKTA